MKIDTCAVAVSRVADATTMQWRQGSGVCAQAHHWANRNIVLSDLQVRPTSDGNSVDPELDVSNEKLDRWADTHGAPAIIVATGFIAKDPKVGTCHLSGVSRRSKLYALPREVTGFDDRLCDVGTCSATGSKHAKYA